MGVASWLFVVVWAVDGSGPAGGLFLRRRDSWLCLVGLLLAGVVGCLLLV